MGASTSVVVKNVKGRKITRINIESHKHLQEDSVTLSEGLRLAVVKMYAERIEEIMPQLRKAYKTKT